MTLDYLIIGQGLAGSLLAWQLHKLGQRVVIIDNASVNTASRIGAGLITPITGKRLVKSPDLSLFLSAAKSCYQQIERTLASRLYHERAIARLLQSLEEVAQYHKRLNDSNYQPYLCDHESSLTANVVAPSIYGALHMKQGGYLDSALLIEKFADYFKQQGMYRQADVNYSDITFDSDQVQWQDLTGKQLVFCEGHRASNNPWFDWLPFTPTKGEIINCKTDRPVPETIIHAGKWLLPLDTHTIRCGATYDWNNLDLQPTEKAREELLEAVCRLVPEIQIDMTDHQVGIRPGTKDRQPFIGRHLVYRQLSIFNGFGSKGALLIPFYSERFSRILCGHSANLLKADIARYH